MRGYIQGMRFDSARARYSLNDLVNAIVVVVFFIYLLDRLRFNSWEKSRSIEQQNEVLKSDKAKIDELLHGIRAAALALSLREGIVPPVVGLQEPLCALPSVIGASARRSVNRAPLSGISFGGACACLVLDKRVP